MIIINFNQSNEAIVDVKTKKQHFTLMIVSSEYNVI